MPRAAAPAAPTRPGPPRPGTPRDRDGGPAPKRARKHLSADRPADRPARLAAPGQGRRPSRASRRRTRPGPPAPPERSRRRRPAERPAPAVPAPRPPDRRPPAPLRRRSPRTGGQIGREPLRHRPADLRVQLPHPRQVLANGKPQAVRHGRQIKSGEPPRQPGWRRRHEGRMSDGNPFPHDEGPREHVTEPPPPSRHERGGARDDPERHQNLDHTDRTTHQRVPEPDRPSVVPHHPQPEGQLPERAAVTQRLHRDRAAHQQQNEARDRHRDPRRIVQGRRRGQQADGDDQIGGHRHGQIEQHRQRPARQFRGAQLQRHRLARH